MTMTEPAEASTAPGHAGPDDPRDAMFAAILARHFGPETRIEIGAASDISGGNNSTSIRRRDLVVDGRPLSLVEKMPSVLPEERIALNLREAWLYDHYFRDHRIASTPRFYGSATEGGRMQLVFGFVPGVRPDLRTRAARNRVLAALGAVNAVPVPADLPFRRTSLSYVAAEQIAARGARLLAEDPPGRDGLARFLADLPAYAARYAGLPTGLGHGDCHGGNILVDGDAVVLIDWTRWGDHPLGSDAGKYLAGLLHRTGTPLTKGLRAYAAAVGADLGDVVFGARYTRIGFLLSLLPKNSPKRGTLLRELAQQAAEAARDP